MRLRSLAVIFALIAVAPQYASAQAFFQAYGFPGTVAATGQTEVLGNIQVSLTQGAVAADTLVINVAPFVITNASASDIQVSVVGNIVTGTVTTSTVTNGTALQLVNIPVNAGGNSGSITVSGIRVALAGTNASSVTANLSWATNKNFLTTTSVTVVGSVQTALIVPPMTDKFQINNNNVIKSTATIVVREGYGGAFVSGALYGENTPTQIRIQVTDFPSGLQMVFPTTVTANETAATLTTVGGAPVTLPLSNGTTTVTYNYNAAGNSSGIAESFNIPFTVSVQGTVGALQPTINVSLAPFGLAVPSTTLPSTSIPRYAESEETALAGTSVIVTQALYWTGIDDTQQNRLSIVNPGSTTSNLTITAMDVNGATVSGTGITNPVTQSLGANQSLDTFLTSLFGAATNIATVQVASTGPNVRALGTVSSNGEFASMALASGGAENFTVPVLETGGSIYLFNPNSLPLTGSLTMLNSQGATVGTTSVTLNSMAETALSLQTAFGPQSTGEITGSFPAPVIAVEAFGSGGNFNLVPAQIPALVSSIYVPVFASGGGYETDLNLINSSTNPITLNLQSYNDASAPVGSPVASFFAPAQQLAQPASQLFSFQSAVAGYAQIQVPQVMRAFFSSYPAITGYATVQAGPSASAVTPLSTNPLQNSYILSSGVPSGYYQGISMINPNSGSVTVTLQVLNSAGTVVGTANETLAPGQILAQLTTQIFSVAVPQQSVIRITASAPIVAASAIGTTNQLRIIPAQ